MSLSESLGAQHEVTLPQGTIRYRERGEGRPLLFVHEFPSNADTWRSVVPLLADRYRCIAPDWPFGPHEVPLEDTADLTAPGIARLFVDFMEALDLDDVVLIGGGGGGTLCQILVSEQPLRVGALVVTSGDPLWRFPPHVLKLFMVVAAIPPVRDLFLRACGVGAVRRAFARTLAKRGPDPEILRSYVELPRRNKAVRRDMARAVTKLRTHYGLAAMEGLRRSEIPALVVWAADDVFFPVHDGRRLAALLLDAQFELMEDARTFIGEDQPERLARLVADFLAGRGASRSQAPVEARVGGIQPAAV